MIPVFKPWINQDEINEVMKALQIGQISAGTPIVRQFETKFAESIGVKYAVATNTATAVFCLALKSLNIQSGDKIMISDMANSSVRDAIKEICTEAVFYSINKTTKTLNIKNNGEAKTIILTHELGHPIKLNTNIPVIEDCSVAHGASIKTAFGRKRKVGTLGRIACFSFNDSSMMTTGGGGCLVTNDFDIYKSLLNTNYRMTALQAAIGLAQLKKLPIIMAMRRQIAKSYDRQLKYTIGRQSVQKWAEVVYPYFYMYVKNGEHILKKLHDAEVGVVAYENNSILGLPCYPGITERDVTLICRIINNALSK